MHNQLFEKARQKASRNDTPNLQFLCSGLFLLLSSLQELALLAETLVRFRSLVCFVFAGYPVFAEIQLLDMLERQVSLSFINGIGGQAP